MPPKLSLVLALGLTAATVAACDRQAQTANPAAPTYAPSSAAAAPLVTPGASAYDNRLNKPVRSGLNNDPDNPSGAPGPGTTMKTMQ